MDILHLIRTQIHAGLAAPVRILHVTDVHVTRATTEDSEEHRALMREREGVFFREGKEPPHTPEEYMQAAIDLAKREGALLVCTGDAIDIHTKGNVAYLQALLRENDMMFSPGGHEHQRQCLRTLEEPYPYAEKIRPLLDSELATHDLYLSSRIVGGLNIITADNSLDYFPARTVEAFRRELSRGLPTVVFFHDPIWDARLNANTPLKNTRLTQADVDTSREMLSLCLTHPAVVATVGGHGHHAEERQIEGKTHYMTDGLFKGIARLITVM